jgi:hypothetical protein
MENFNFNRANINTQKRKYRINQSKKNIQEFKINPILQESEIQLFKIFWPNHPIKYHNENWNEFIKE